MSQEKIDQFYGEWYEHPDLKDLAPAEFKKRVDDVLEALRDHNREDRPLNILAVHGSGRHPVAGCAREISNSQMLLEKALDPYREEGYDIESVHLREYNISPCNGCVGTASLLCGFPCDCFPFDPMQKLYPKVLRCDVLLCSTPVWQSTVASRMKLFIDRLISLDGGFFRKEYHPKTNEFRNRAIELSREGNFEYTQRMFGRVGAYFISAKDQNNPDDIEFDFIGKTADVMRSGMDSYGIDHADKWYVGFAGKWDEDYSHDKRRLNEDTDLHTEAQVVVGQAISLAKEFRENPPQPMMGRMNRT